MIEMDILLNDLLWAVMVYYMLVWTPWLHFLHAVVCALLSFLFWSLYFNNSVQIQHWTPSRYEQGRQAARVELVKPPIFIQF